MNTRIILILSCIVAFSGRAGGISPRIPAADGCNKQKELGTDLKFRFTVKSMNGQLQEYVKDCPPNKVFKEASCQCESLDQGVGNPPPVLEEKPTAPLLPPLNCKFKEVKGEPNFFLELTNQGWEKRPCSDGSKFELIPSCSCVHSELVNETCNPDVDINVDNKGVMESWGGLGRAYKVPINSLNVESDVTGISFDGTSAIRIDRLSGVEFQHGLSISFEFREDAPIVENQVLLTNCNSTLNKFSIEVSVGRNAQSVFVAFRLDVGKERYYQKDVEFTSTGFKVVKAVYDGTNFTGKVDGEQRRMTLNGPISPIEAPMLVGNTLCSETMGFKGKIRNLQIYPCVKNIIAPA